MTAGSSLWQIIFISFALLLVAFEMARGWRLGLVRQLVRLVALGTAYATGIFGGRMLLPILRPLLRAPDFIISLVAGAILAFVVYAAISAAGAILFKRTGQQSAGMVRLVYGITGGLLGIFFGLFSVWLAVVAIRSVGAIAGAEMRAPPSAQGRTTTPTSAQNGAPLMLHSLAKLKNSLELGPLGSTFKTVDPVPAQTYQTLGKVGTVVSNPRSAVRFLDFPGAQSLAQNPRIVALQRDLEIVEMVEQQRFLDLLQSPKVIDALNDPALAAAVKSFDFQKALDYALEGDRREGPKSSPSH
ncbi:MAG: hypothetical protein ACR2G0_09650 [Chthoniobacterales bacterium]